MSHLASRTLLWGIAFLWGTGTVTAGAWEIPAQVKVELVRVVTEDGVTLQGALYRPEPKVNARPKRAVLVTHGTGGSFYGSITGFLPPLLAEKGYLGLGLNRRDSGHRYYRSTFEDGVKDLKAGIDYLISQGAEEIFLVGHSLGSTFVPYYMAITEDPRVKLVGLSGAIADLRQATVDTHLGSRSKYDEVVREAKIRMDQGRGDELFLISLFGRMEALSYHTFLNYRGPEANTVPVNWIPKIQRPFLLLHNSTDKLARVEWQEELKKAGAGKMDYIEVIDPDPTHTPGQGHSYLGVESKVTTEVADWLARKDFLPGKLH
ncbi:MAG: alpha/beta hydrolase family protein [Acidobacteriota bacterium]|nr:DUF1749 domain-containing protein [Acidobacteriota bacterium]